MAATYSNGQFVLWNAQNNLKQYEQQVAQELHHARWSFSGDKICLGTKHRVSVLDLSSQPQLPRLTGHVEKISSACLVLSPDGKYLASGSADRTVIIWNVQTRKPIHVLRGHQKKINALAWSPDSQQLLSGGDDSKVYLWDIKTAKVISEFVGHTLPVEMVDWSEDGRQLWTRAFQGEWFLWDVASKTIMEKMLQRFPQRFFQRNDTDSHFYVIKGNDILIVPKALTPAEISRRKYFYQPNKTWHLHQADESHELGLRFSEIFHLQKILVSNPQTPQIRSRLEKIYFKMILRVRF